MSVWETVHEKQHLGLWLLGLDENNPPPGNVPVNYLLFGGAEGGGKSRFDRFVAAECARQWPGSKGAIFRRKSGEVYATHVKPLLAELPEGSGKLHMAFNRMTYRWANGSETDFHHCFRGDTKFLTDQGEATLAEKVGETVNVWHGQGWGSAEIRSFGTQEIFRIELSPVVNYRRVKTASRVVVYATREHTWPLVTTSPTQMRQTTALRVGHTVRGAQLTVDHATDDLASYHEGLRHGLIFGDGTTCYRAKDGRYSFQLPMHGKKVADLAYLFGPIHMWPSRSIISNYEGTVYYHSYDDLKALPIGKNPAYIAGFLHGWTRADGNDINATTVALNSGDRAALDWAKEVAPYAGWTVTGDSLGGVAETNYGTRTRPLHRIVFSTRPVDWRVMSITPAGESEVLCAVVDHPSHQFTLANGVLTGNCNDPEDYLNQASEQWDYLIIDESTQFTVEQITYFLGRVRSTKKGWWPIVVLTSNPPGESQAWHVEYFVEGHEPVGDQLMAPPWWGPKLANTEFRPRCAFLPSRLKDNPSLPYDITMAGMMQRPDPVLREALVNGDWHITGDTFFPQFKTDVHVIPARPVPEEWIVWRGLDWGRSDPFGCLWAARDPTDKYPRTYIFREYYEQGLSDWEMARRVLDLSEGDPRCRVNFCDPTILTVNRKGISGPNHGAEWKRAGLTDLAGANNRRPLGWSRVHKALSPAPHGPELQIMDNCPELIRELRGFRRNPNKPEDIIEPDNPNSRLRDEAGDCLRYLLLGAAPASRRPPRDRKYKVGVR